MQLLKKILLLYQLENNNVKMPDFHDEVTKKTKPEWLKIKLKTDEQYQGVAKIVRDHGLHTICSSGKCPNQAECWSRRTATFMILGDICTRNCKFCATQTGRPLPPDSEEPRKIVESIAIMGLKHSVITSVTRDDLSDGGAHHWAAVVSAIRRELPNVTVELLIPDMDGRSDLLDIIIESKPHILGHNIETVARLTSAVRSRARFDVSMRTLRYMSESGIPTKSGLMVGLGETEREVFETMDSLLDNGCKILTIGQYLQPTKHHIPVSEYVLPETFLRYKEEALAKGFRYVESGPLVRSSYMAHKAMESLKS